MKQIAIICLLLLGTGAAIVTAEDTPSAAALTADVAFASHTESTQAAWRGIVPGITTLADVLGQAALRNDVVQQTERSGKTTLLFPPGCDRGDTRFDLTFGRVVEVVFDVDGVCEYVHIGGFYRDQRPTLEALSKTLAVDMGKAVSKSSAYSANSSVFVNKEAGLWLIASNIGDPTRNGEHQVLVLRFFAKGRNVELPLPKVPYKR